MKMSKRDYQQRAVEYRIAFMSGYAEGVKQGDKAFTEMMRIITGCLLKKSDVDRVMKVAEGELAKIAAARRAAERGKLVRGPRP